MKNLRFLKHNLTQRITYDDTLTRIGRLSNENLNNILLSLAGRKNIILKGGAFELSSLLTFKIQESSFWLHKKTLSEVTAISQARFVEVTLDAESSGNDRIDLIEARALTQYRRPVIQDQINQVSSVVTQQSFKSDEKITLDIKVTKGTPAGTPACPIVTGLSLANFINDGNQGEGFDDIDLSGTIDLSSLFNLKISIDNSVFQTIDCQGASPSATNRTEIVTAINANGTFAAMAITFAAQAFVSTGTLVTITSVAHGLTTGQTIITSASTNAGDLPNDYYVVTVLTVDTFTVTTAAAGDDVGGNVNWDFKVAAPEGTNYIKIQSPTNIESSNIRFMPPAAADASAIILGIIEETNYFYKFEATYDYFKIGEVLVQDSAASLITSDLRDGYNKENWTTTDGEDITKVYDLYDIFQNIEKENLLINGNFRFAQRGSSGTAVFTLATAPSNSDDTYLLDRWNHLDEVGGAGSDVVDISQDTDIPGTRGLSMKSLVATANNKWGFVQIIENAVASELQDKKVSLSFWAKTTTGAIINNIRAGVISTAVAPDNDVSDVVSAWNASGSNPTLAGGWAFENTPDDLALVADTWKKYTIEGIEIDTVGMTNIAVFIWIDDDDGTVNDEMFLAEVNLIVSDTVIPSKYRQFEKELILCQRFYEKSYNNTVAPGTATADGASIIQFNNVNNSDYSIALGVHFKVVKIINAPTIKVYNITNGTINEVTMNAGAVAGTAQQPSQKGFYGEGTNGAVSTDRYLHFQWYADAEL